MGQEFSHGYEEMVDTQKKRLNREPTDEELFDIADVWLGNIVIYD
jgi:hypothetical protein